MQEVSSRLWRAKASPWGCSSILKSYDKPRERIIMGYRFFIKASFIALWIAVAFWLGADSLQAQKQTSGKNKFPGEHSDEKLNPQRPDKQVSDLTSSVASKLPHAGAIGGKIAIRNLIDQQLFGAIERDGVPHAPLSNDYEFCRRIFLDLTGRIPTPDQLKTFVTNA